MNSKRRLVDELHKQARKNFVRRRVIMKGIDDLWQADLVEMNSYSKFNKNYAYRNRCIFKKGLGRSC